MWRSTKVVGRIIGLSLLGAAAGYVQAQPSGSPTARTAQPVKVSDELQELVNAFFATPGRDERRALVPSIERAAARDARAVAEALKRVNVWSAADEGAVNIFFPGPGRPRVAGVFEVPLGYSSDRAFPMVLFVPDAGLEPEVMLARTRLFLGEHTNDYLVAGTTAEIAGTFHQSSADRGKLRALVRRLRKHVHTDTNRLYILGVGTGADAAWLAAIRNPDLFAGVIAINGYPNVPYPKQAYPMMLESLRHVPVLSVWNDPAPASSGLQERATAVAKHNKLIAQLAESKSLPIRIVKLPYSEPADRHPPVDAISNILGRNRVVAPKVIDHWFRYREHGKTAWLRQTRFAGDVWDQEALSVATAAGADRNAVITNVFREKMAQLSGTVEGQTVTLKVSRTAGVELMLPLGVLDEARDVTVTCNGRTRHEHKLPPAIDIMLKDAYERWEFLAPAAIRLSLSVKSEN